MEEQEKSIENRLKELRKERELSQESLAEELGISRQSIIALEQGKCLPSLPLVVSMCKFFDKAFEDIFNFEHDFVEEMDNIVDRGMKIKVINGAVAPIGQLPGKENMTELQPWRPFREAVSLRDAVDRLMEDSFITPKSAGVSMPKVDIKERKEDVLVRAEIPGINEEDLNVEVSSDGLVTISGEKKEEISNPPAGGEEGYFYRESHFGNFSRTFSLPTEIVAEKAVADIENGILTLTIPKAKPQKTQKIKVSTKKTIKK